MGSPSGNHLHAILSLSARVQKSGLSELPVATCWWVVLFPSILGSLKNDCCLSLTPPQSRTRTRAARRCRSPAALSPRPSSTAPSAPPTEWAPPLPPLPRPPPPPPRPTRAQRRASRGGAPSRSRRGADDEQEGVGEGAGLRLTRDSDLYLFSVSFVRRVESTKTPTKCKMFSLEWMETLELAL